ncbi:hypothetical protein [Arthrobacter ginkgonis]|uniref:hypothetical protein n=1 Tax=Arthrobacter ginkgonis TaxID=1630594 RepID=UPI0031E5B2DF
MNKPSAKAIVKTGPATATADNGGRLEARFTVTGFGAFEAGGLAFGGTLAGKVISPSGQVLGRFVDEGFFMFIPAHEVNATCSRFSVLLTNVIRLNGVRYDVHASAVVAEKPGRSNDPGTALCDVAFLIGPGEDPDGAAALLNRIVKVAS